MRHRRTYTFSATRPGGFMFWPSRVVTSNLRIRELLIVLHRKWFGTEPNFHWHLDGDMGATRDKRGNEIHVDQVNWYHRFNRGATTQRRPCCPMRIKEAA